MRSRTARTIFAGTCPSIAGKYTFISAFESSPVHCLNPRPLGKRRSPENGAIIEILYNVESRKVDLKPTSLPIIDVFEDPVGSCLTVGLDKPLLDPLDDVVFERPFDNLMEEVWGDHFVDVSSGEMGSKRLYICV